MTTFFVCSPPNGAVSRTEDASAAAEGFPQSVESAVLRAFEDAFDVTGCRFLRFRKCIRWSRRLFSAPLKMRSVHQKAVSGTEYPSRTVEACFLHRMLPMMRRVPQEAFLSTARIFRTVEACFWYGALPKTHRTWLSGAQKSGWQLPLRGLSNHGRGRGKGPPETSSALAGRRKWWKGPERTK